MDISSLGTRCCSHTGEIKFTTGLWTLVSEELLQDFQHSPQQYFQTWSKLLQQSTRNQNSGSQQQYLDPHCGQMFCWIAFSCECEFVPQPCSGFWCKSIWWKQKSEVTFPQKHVTSRRNLWWDQLNLYSWNWTLFILLSDSLWLPVFSTKTMDWILWGIAPNKGTEINFLFCVHHFAFPEHHCPCTPENIFSWNCEACNTLSNRSQWGCLWSYGCLNYVVWHEFFACFVLLVECWYPLWTKNILQCWLEEQSFLLHYFCNTNLCSSFVPTCPFFVLIV